jgi:acetyl-CoA synthetase (ADP-forming)
VAAKVVVPGGKSKSDMGGVRLGIGNTGQLKKNISELMRIDKAEGVLVEEMAPPGIEVITGGIIDPQFGPVVMFGLGGLFVEAMKDVVFALAPLEEKDALELIKRIKGYKVLAGFRGHPPADIGKLAQAVVLVSEIIGSKLVKEIDLNPLVVYPDGVMVLDAKIFRR